MLPCNFNVIILLVSIAISHSKYINRLRQPGNAAMGKYDQPQADVGIGQRFGNFGCYDLLAR
jgi:hypothetical protein